MTDYTDIALSALLPGEPWTSGKALAVYENPIAIAEGAIDAPRILLTALERITAGTTIRSRNDTIRSVGDSETATAHAFSFIQTGVVRVSYTMTSNGNATGSVRRIRDGTAATLVSNTSGGTYTIDAAVLPGDLIEIRMVVVAFSSGSISNCRFQTGGANLWPAPGVRLENTYA